MKVIFLTLALCAVLNGCANSNNGTNNASSNVVENNVSTNVVESNTSGETAEVNNVEVADEEKEIEKYKLTDDINLTYDMIESLYNIYYDDYIVNKNYEYTLDGTAHTISVERLDYLRKKIFIDGKEITSAINYEHFENLMDHGVSAIGFIELDNKPYLVIRWWEGEIAGVNLFSINSNLELKYEESFNEMFKFGDKCIEPTFFRDHDTDHYASGVVIGYTYYENGEWKYINRSINGKIIIDDEGNVSDEVYIEGKGHFGPGMYWEGFYTHKKDSSISLLTSSKYRIIKMYIDEPLVFDIEMLEDSTWGDPGKVDYQDSEKNFDENGNWIGEIQNEEHIPKGTIVKNVVIH